MENKTKICSHCHKEKDLDDFSKGNSKDGKRSWCKTCISDYYQEPEHKEKSNKLSKDYYKRKGREETILRKINNIQEHLFISAKNRANKRNEEFTITVNDIIVPEICPLLGLKMQYNRERKEDNSFSLDRIDSTKGYIPGNIWVISLRANRIKNDSTIEELEMIVNNLKKLNK